MRGPDDRGEGMFGCIRLPHASGTAERAAMLVMLDRRKRRHRITLGANKASDVTDFVGDLRARNVTPHIAVNGTVSMLGAVRKTAIDLAVDNGDPQQRRLRPQPTLPH